LCRWRVGRSPADCPSRSDHARADPLGGSSVEGFDPRNRPSGHHREQLISADIPPVFCHLTMKNLLIPALSPKDCPSMGASAKWTPELGGSTDGKAAGRLQRAVQPQSVM